MRTSSASTAEPISDAAARAALAAAEATLARYCPHRPWPKQQAFLNLISKEAFYGGAAGGGKSHSLLMGALQFVDVPGYAALILRRDTQRLQLAGGLIPRSHQWLSGTGAHWQGSLRRWTFPAGDGSATISFGYLRDSNDKFRYGSSEYQYIAFDELTEFPEDDYLFLFSRLRRTRDMNVPLRVRSASNPGNLGHQWVKRRFISDDALLAGSAAGTSDDVSLKNGITYIPARIRDNPALEEALYRDSLMHLPPLERERLMNGDWSVRQEGLFRPGWLRYFKRGVGQLDLLHPTGELFCVIPEGTCRRFATIDPAGTSADKAREQRGRAPSWTVVQVWEQPWGEQSKLLMLRHQARRQVGFQDLCHMLREIHHQWNPERFWIENEKLGKAAVDILQSELPLECVSTKGRDKVTRAAALITKMERGEVYFPQREVWLAELEAELLGWSGREEEPSDQIDAAAYAAQIANQRATGIVRVGL